MSQLVCKIHGLHYNGGSCQSVHMMEKEKRRLPPGEAEFTGRGEEGVEEEKASDGI